MNSEMEDRQERDSFRDSGGRAINYISENEEIIKRAYGNKYIAPVIVQIPNSVGIAHLLREGALR